MIYILFDKLLLQAFYSVCEQHQKVADLKLGALILYPIRFLLR